MLVYLSMETMVTKNIISYKMYSNHKKLIKFSKVKIII